MKRTSLAALLLALLCWPPSLGAAPKVIISHAITLHGQPKYKAGFTHFDYVNPNAPKGGTLRLSSIGTYDNFNRYAQRGVAADGSTSFYDTLMTASEDEIEVYYGLIAEKVEYPEDYTWIIFHLNPKARFQDGKPITAEDVVFSFNKFLNEGRAAVQAVLPGRDQGGGSGRPARALHAEAGRPAAADLPGRA